MVTRVAAEINIPFTVGGGINESFFLQTFYGCGYGAEVLFLIVAFQFEVHVCVNCMCKMDRRILLMGLEKPADMTGENLISDNK